MKFFSFVIFLTAFSAFGYEWTMSSTRAVDDKNYITIDYQINTRAQEMDAQNVDLQRIVGNMYYAYSTVKVTKKINSKIFTSAIYDIGEFGLRNIDKKFLNTEAKKHFLLAGASFIFGDGNADGDTLVAKMSAGLKSYHIYNYGYCAGAPNNTLALMENYPWHQNVHEPEGLFIYYFNVEPEMQRVIGSMQMTGWNQGKQPYYKLDWSGRLTRVGDFNDRFFVTAFYKWLNKFSWISSLKKDFPRPGAGDIELVTQMFKQMKNDYLERYPKGKFAVVIKNSGKPYVNDLIQKLKGSLQAKKIDFIEMSLTNLPTDKVLLPKYDFHPNGAGNSLVASELIEKLGKINYLTR